MYIYGQKIVCLISEQRLKYCCLIYEWLIKKMLQKVHMQLLLICVYAVNCLSIICVRSLEYYSLSCFMYVQ